MALLLAFVLGSPPPAPATPTGLRDVIVVFHNDMWDDAWVDFDVRIFFTRDQVLAAAGEMPELAGSSTDAEFTAWVRGLKKPGFHVYDLGFEHHGALVTRLLERFPGWICCGEDGQFVPTGELKVAVATAAQLRRAREAVPKAPAERRYFQMQRYGERLRIWIYDRIE